MSLHSTPVGANESPLDFQHQAVQTCLCLNKLRSGASIFLDRTPLQSEERSTLLSNRLIHQL